YTTSIYTLSLHDALPIFHVLGIVRMFKDPDFCKYIASIDRERPGEHIERADVVEHFFIKYTKGVLNRLHALEHRARVVDLHCGRSEEHTSELQSLAYLVC